MVSLRGPVLIVEDDPDIRESLQHFLEAHGYPVVAASHGKEALEYLGRAPRPSMVVLDMNLPVMDGNRLLTARKGDDLLRTIPVVILSAALGGMSPRDRALYASSYGVAAFLGKPADPRQVLEAVERHGLRAEETSAGVPV
ncbi:response regulator receiver domain-containing protein [Archangium gephyra]|uniref:Response regulator receiver domain-containing protein n=3 Tax=Archangium gephyra TaxID=48 RepID=A0ABX9JZ22_9BACT|nr:response regulator [Archangium gephyra]REG29801.1 response regulator receiver domain-containing protein [Archangium gephyra]